MGTYTYHASKKHQLSSTSNGWSFAHDANGNMTSGRGATVTWTSYNYPATIANGTDTAAFSYTPDRQYWKQISNYTSGGAATTIYVAGILEKVTAGGFTDFRHMIRAGGSKIIVSRSTSGTNTVNYVTSDHLGSNSAVTNSSGGMLVNSSFDAFGKRRGANWTGIPSAGDWVAIASTSRRGYTDHTMIDNLSLIQMNGRVQDPVLGRFVSADPFITEPGLTQNYNRYSYVYNNPLRFRDPSGFGATDCGESGSSNSQPDTYDSSDDDESDGYKNGSSESGSGAADCSPDQSHVPDAGGTQETGEQAEIVVTGERPKPDSADEPERQPPPRDGVPDPNRGGDFPTNQNSSGTAGGAPIDKYADETEISQKLGEYPVRAPTKLEDAADDSVRKMEADQKALEALAEGDVDKYAEYRKQARHLQFLWYKKQGTYVPESSIPLDLYIPVPKSPAPDHPEIDIPMHFPPVSEPN